MNLTNEQIKMLAEAERMMDSGEKKYVILEGERLMVTDEVMVALGLQPKQTINQEIFVAIQEENLKMIRLQIQPEKVKDEANNN